jgi:hypothetical protein
VWNVTLVVPVLMPSSGISSPRRAPPIPVQIAHQPWPDTRGAPDSSLPAGDGPGGAGGDTGGGTGAWPASPDGRTYR